MRRLGHGDEAVLVLARFHAALESVYSVGGRRLERQGLTIGAKYREAWRWGVEGRKG